MLFGAAACNRTNTQCRIRGTEYSRSRGSWARQCTAGHPLFSSSPSHPVQRQRRTRRPLASPLPFGSGRTASPSRPALAHPSPALIHEAHGVPSGCNQQRLPLLLPAAHPRKSSTAISPHHCARACISPPFLRPAQCHQGLLRRCSIAHQGVLKRSSIAHQGGPREVLNGPSSDPQWAIIRSSWGHHQVLMGPSSGPRGPSGGPKGI